MMAYSGAVRNRHAFLIGINGYQDKPLACCIEDVNSMRMYLESLPGFINIQMFAADTATSKTPSRSAGNKVQWPSHDNVTSAIATTASRAMPGDFVYFHFSGHGTRATPYGEFSNESTGDLALVLLDNNRKPQYLWGPRLALSLKTMVENGVIVTVVLDCCFSASVYRKDDPRIRFLSYDETIEPLYSSRTMSLENSFTHEGNGPVTRNASMSLNWLINPSGYAILASCGPDEEGSEFTFRDGETHGALSFFLLRALTKCGGPTKTLKNIYDHLCADFKRFWPKQNPVLYGNKYQGFLGQDETVIISTTGASIIANSHGNLEIQAGEAHGISQGDLFALRPPSSEQQNDGLGVTSRTAKVVETRALTSDLALAEGASTDIKTGWVATALSQSSLHNEFSIALGAGLSYKQDIQDSLAKRCFHARTDDGKPVNCYVAPTSEGYKILDQYRQSIIVLPSKGQKDLDVGLVSDLVGHLARFQLLKELSNTTVNQSFKDSFNVKVVTSSGNAFHADSMLEVEHKARIEVVIENSGAKMLYIFVYDMSPNFMVKNLIKGSFQCLPARDPLLHFTGVYRKKIEMTVPLEGIRRGLHDCEDLIKVFVTSLPTTFDSYELPELGKVNLSSFYKQTAVSRADQNSSNHTSEDWVALNFHVRTVVNIAGTSTTKMAPGSATLSGKTLSLE